MDPDIFSKALPFAILAAVILSATALAVCAYTAVTVYNDGGTDTAQFSEEYVADCLQKMKDKGGHIHAADSTSFSTSEYTFKLSDHVLIAQHKNKGYMYHIPLSQITFICVH